MLKPETEIYLLALRMQSAISEMKTPKVGLNKSIRSLDIFVSKHSSNAELMNSKTHARAVHNWNVVLNSIDLDTLSLPIGELTVEK